MGGPPLPDPAPAKPLQLRWRHRPALCITGRRIRHAGYQHARLQALRGCALPDQCALGDIGAMEASGAGLGDASIAAISAWSTTGPPPRRMIQLVICLA